MANHVTAFIYGQNGGDWGNNGGVIMGFPSANVLFFPLQPSVTISGAVTVTKIKVLGTGTDYLTSPEFYTDKTVADLVTQSNT